MPERAELIHERQIDVARQAVEQPGPVAGDPGEDDELVLVDQAEFRQRRRERQPPNRSGSAHVRG